MIYKVVTKDDSVVIEAKNRDHAFARYFADIANGKIPLSKVGQLVTLYDGEEQYPFRTIPLLWLLGVIDKKHAILNISNLLKCSRREAEELLLKTAKEDSRLVYLVRWYMDE